MPSKLSATAPSFSLPSKSSASVAESPIAIACRENEEIGTYEGGVLKPRKGITSRISWNENVPFATNARSATIEPVAASPHEESTSQLVTLPADTCAHEALQTHITCNDTSSIRHDEDLTFNMVQPDLAQESNYQTSTPQSHGLHEQFPGDHQLNHQAITHFYPPTYQLHVALPCDVVVSEANRPSWNPAYHRTISPSIERANRVVEEFKLYFGDGRSPELLLKNLQKICVLCGLSKADDMPTTSDECVTVRFRLPILSPMFVIR